MINLAGLSATYPGYQAQEDQTAKTQLNQTRARDAAIKLLGANVLGAALAGNAGPQAPAPGQASVPAAPPAPPTPAQPIPAPTGPAPAVPPVVAPVSPVGGAPVAGKLGLQQMTAQILQRAPGVAGHPEVLLAALKHAKDLGLLDPEAEAKIDAIGSQHTMARVEAAKGHLKAVQEAATPAAPAAGMPPVTLLKPNIVTTFANGQKWTIGSDNQPKQVQ